MWKIIGIIFLVVLIIALRKVKIKWLTFFQRGFKKETKPYGVYCYCGKQGKGKTYSVIEFLLHNKDKKIYANINSLQNVNYTYFSGFEELLKLRDEHDCIIVYDEIFTALTKQSKMNTDVLDFLSQMRKRRIVFITTAQEWLEINMTLRRYCRYQIECNMISLFGYPILIKKMYDAEQMKWSQLDNEYIAPLIDTTISHGLKKVIKSYDTFEQINGNVNRSVENRFSQNDIQTNEIEQSSKQENHEITDTTTSNFVVNGQSSSEDIIFEEIKTNSDTDFWNDLEKEDFENE